MKLRYIVVAATALMSTAVVHADKKMKPEIKAIITKLDAMDNYLGTPEMDKFIYRMVTKHGFEKKKLEALFATVKPQGSVIRRITTPWEGKPWYQYRPIFLQDSRINQGVDFWNENRALLNQARKKYGVPAQVITAIIGVETRYGKYRGKDKVLDSLATLGFSYPRRAKFFSRELEEFLLLCREEGLDPHSIKGSYAGAMGMPQFIPSSYRAYAVDFDGDGKRDLFNSKADIIGSVANYFAVHGWKQGQPVTFDVTLSKKLPKNFKLGYELKHTLKSLRKAGVRMDTKLNRNTKAALIDFKLEKGMKYAVGLKNFYVITRYNRSKLYARAVYQLSEEIAAKYYP